MNIIRLKLDHDKDILFNFLVKIDKDFGIPLSNKIDLEFYAVRLLNKGYVLAIEENGYIVSVLGFYCNNFQQRTAYLPLLGTIKEACGKGYARLLIVEMIKICQQVGMAKICCNSINPIAVHLYKSIGFIEISREKEGEFNKCFLEYKIS